MIEYTVQVYNNGNRFWYLNTQCHREDGPAAEYAEGTKRWYLNGELHREDGPAIEYSNSTKYWYLNGQRMTEAEHKAATQPVKEMTLKEVIEQLGYNVKIVE